MITSKARNKHALTPEQFQGFVDRLQAAANNEEIMAEIVDQIIDEVSITIACALATTLSD